MPESNWLGETSNSRKQTINSRYVPEVRNKLVDY